LSRWKTGVFAVLLACNAVLGIGVLTREEGPRGPPARIALQSTDDGRQVRLRRGQEVTVALPALSASGYRCGLRDPLPGLLSLEQVPPRVGGTPGWIFRTLQPGRGVLRFECRQELSDGPMREFQFHLQID